jgi:hypothetical protein
MQLQYARFLLAFRHPGLTILLWGEETLALPLAWL